MRDMFIKLNFTYAQQNLVKTVHKQKKYFQKWVDPVESTPYRLKQI